MKILKVLIVKEIKYYISNNAIYLDISILSILIGICIFLNGFLNNFSFVNQILIKMPYLLMIFASVLSMSRFILEENDSTLELLRSFPIDESEIVLSKFLSTSIYTSFISIILIPALLIFNQFNILITIFQFLGLLLLLIMFLAIGCFYSLICKSQAHAFLFSFMSSFFLYHLHDFYSILFTHEASKSVISYMSLETHYLHVINGMNMVSSIIFFLSIIFVFIYIAIQVFRQK